MFSDLGSFAEPKLSMEHFREWAGQIASGYLNSNVAPTESLVKIAQIEELTPSQIETLAGESNKLIHQLKFGSAKEKYFAADFPLADAKIACSRLQARGEGAVEVDMPMPKVAQDNKFDAMLYKAFGVEPEAPMDKTASVRHELKTAAIRGELVSQKCADDAYMKKVAMEGAERTFIKTARQHVIGADCSLDRMKRLGDVDHMAKQANLIECSRKPLEKLAYALGREGLLEPKHAKLAMEYFAKEGGEEAPKELISDFLSARVVNGTHPLYITLKTFNDCSSALDLSRERYQLVDDKLRVVAQKIRSL